MGALIVENSMSIYLRTGMMRQFIFISIFLVQVYSFEIGRQGRQSLDVCDANTPCTGTNEDCDLENSLCLCATGFQRNPAVGKEKECIAAPLGLGNPCGDNTLLPASLKDGTCDAANNQECSLPDGVTPATQTVCQCQAKFAPNANKTACESSVGGPCKPSETAKPADMCNQDNQLCMDLGGDAGICVCDTAKHFVNKDGNCVASPGATCTVANGPSGKKLADLTTGECRFLENQNCKGGKCECKANCGRDASGLCMPGIGADCGANAADQFKKGDAGCNLGTKCMTKDQSAASATGANVDDKCACNKDEKFVEDDTRPGWCVPAEGGACTKLNAVDGECSHLPNQDCATDKCACTPGNEPQANDDGVNVCVTSLGGDCTSDNDCQLTGSECNAGKCQCKAEFDDDNTAATAGGACKAKIGGTCAVDGDCTTDLSCQDKTCKCNFKADIFKNELKGKCEITIGGSCATDGPADCKFENQECQDPSKDNAAVTTKGVAGAVCGCKAPFVDNMMGACENGPGAECAKDSDCPASLKLLCDPVAKKCSPGKDGLCEKDAVCPFANQECQSSGAPVTVATPGAKCECKRGSTASGPDNLLCEGWQSGVGCSTAEKCKVDEGDCNDDTVCENGLKCGINNCPADQKRPLADCCYNPADIDPATECLGGSKLTWSCCSSEKKCGENQGDCDTDDECEDGLVCGANACNDAFNANFDAAGFFPAKSADCCIKQSASLFYNTHDESGYDMRVEYWQNYDEPQKDLPKYWYRAENFLHNEYFRYTVLTRYMVALCFPTLVFFARLSLKIVYHQF